MAKRLYPGVSDYSSLMTNMEDHWGLFMLMEEGIIPSLKTKEPGFHDWLKVDVQLICDRLQIPYSELKYKTGESLAKDLYVICFSEWPGGYVTTYSTADEYQCPRSNL